MKTKEEAERLGRRVLKRLKGKGWRVDVWHNLHWCVAWRNNGVDLHPCDDKRYFHALVCSTHGGSGGLACWTGDDRFTDPNKAVAYALKNARSYVDSLDSVVKRYEERIYGRVR